MDFRNQILPVWDSGLDDPDQVLAEAEQAGVNVAALKHNLKLSPDERLDQFLKALAWLEWSREARREEMA